MIQKYQILIEDKNGVWKQLDMGTDNIAWNYQVNDIAELVSRQASYSQRLRLPKTTNNVIIFEYANNRDVVTGFPYQKHNCRVFCADRTIAGKGSFLILLKVTDSFECQILSGNANFFETLQNSLMSDLDLGVYQICNASMNPSTWHPAYKLAYSFDIIPNSYPFVSPGLIYEYISSAYTKYPLVSIDYIIKQIMLKQGYTLHSNADIWVNKYLSINSADVKPSEDDLLIFQGKAKTGGVINNQNFNNRFLWSVSKNADTNLKTFNDDPFSGWGAYLYYVLPGAQKTTFTVKTIPQNTAVAVKVYVRSASGKNLLHTVFPLINYETIIIDSSVRTYKLEPDLLRPVYEDGSPAAAIHIYAEVSGTITTGGLEIQIDSFDMLPTNAGGKLVISERTGFETQLDFIKFFAQAFGLTFIVNEATKNIYAFTFQLLYDNIKAGNVKDWSNKVDSNPKSSLIFTLDKYAQENIINLEDSKDNVTDSGRFYIDNKTLQLSKELFKIAIEAGRDVIMKHNKSSKLCAAIPLVSFGDPITQQTNEDGDTQIVSDYSYLLKNATFPTIKPHLVELSEETIWIIVSGFNDFAARIANHVTGQKIVDMSYSILQNKILKNAQSIEDDFYLTPEDIEQFDPTIPVYITKYGAYFYVNKINNFEPGKLTTCQLIRL